MARNSLMPQMQLYDAPQAPSVAGFTNPLMQGLQTYRQGMQQQFEGDRALVTEARQGEQLQLAKNQDARAGEAQRMAKERAEVERLGKLAQVISDDPNDATASQRWQGILQGNPQMGALLQKYNVDPRDHRTGAKFLMAEVGSYMSPAQKEQEQLKTDLLRAQTSNLNRREEPEIVRQLRAAGVDPQSEHGRGMILNSIKGGDPISQAIAERMRMGAPQSQQSPIRPQSFAPGQQDPNLVLTQSAPQPAQQQAQAEPPVDTPLGPMPRDQARLFGFGLAMQGKGEAGKMFAEPANAGAIGKEGQNELDKKMIAASDNLANLSSVRAQFRPEFQQIENRLGMAWTAFADKFKKGQALVRPEDRAQLEAFSAYRSDALDTMNNYIKAITGAAMTDAEAKRIMGALPAVGEGVFDGDGPTAFKAKLDGAFDKTAAAIARYNYARKNGKDWQMIGIEQMKTVVRNRGKQLEQEILRANPSIDRSALPGEVTKLIKREFGI